MCGIAGIAIPAGKGEVPQNILERMNAVQFHRGPDEGGLHVENQIGLAHRRLSIIDLSTGQQPLYSADRSVVIVFNGEIYNFQALTRELQSLGYRFQTHSDTEVIVHAWEAWGEASVERLQGMFAYAIWDRKQHKLFLARDRIGIKPLYYALLANGTLIFGSELKALTTHPDLSLELEPTAIEEYFTLGYIPEPKTVYKGASKLSPGWTLTFTADNGRVSLRQYWDIAFQDAAPMNEAEVQEELITRFRTAVRSHMVSEVPLGAFLSGGVDSSGVVAMMAQVSDKPINTCSIAFTDKRFNEAEFARQVAERYHTDHHEGMVNADDFDLIDKLATLYDEPFADSSAMPTYRVCENARKRVTVALSGDGGDELFAGYRRYKWHMKEESVRQRLPLWLRRPVFGALGRLYPKADWAPQVLRAKTTFQALSKSSLEAYCDNSAVVPEYLRSKLFSNEMRRTLEGYRTVEVFERHAAACPSRDPLSLVQYLDLKTYLPGDILTKVDRASMAHSLEVRVPVLDHKFMEWTATVPSSLKLRGWEGKYIFKRALEPHLPREVLYRPKMGFAVPLVNWFRGPLRERLRALPQRDALRRTGWLDMQFLEKMVSDHIAGLRDHSAALWSVLMFESFLRRLDER